MNSKINSWFILAVIFSIFSSANSIMQKVALKDEKVDPTAMNIYFPILVSIMVLPAAILYWQPLPNDFNVWAVVTIRSLLYLSGILYFKALKEMEVSQITILSSTRLLWVLVGGALILEESINEFKVLGVILIIFGIIIVYWKKDSLKGIGKPHLLILIYAFMIGIAGITDKYLVGYFNLYTYQIIAFLPSAIINAIIMPGSAAKIEPLLKFNKVGLIIIAGAFIYNIGCLALFEALKIGGEASRVSPVSQISMVFTVLAGIVFLRERNNLVRKIAGAAVVFSGVLMIKLF